MLLSEQIACIDTFDHKAIRRRMYQLYKAKVMATEILMMRIMHPALSRMMQLQALSSNTECYNGACNLGFMHTYSAWLFFFLLLCFRFLLIMKSIACNHSRLYYVSLQMPEEQCMRMLANATVADPSGASLQLSNLLYCEQLNKEHKILLGL